MNLFSIIGFSLAAFVLGFGMITATGDASSFLDFHAFLIVVGGTIAAGAISFQLDRVSLLIKVFLSRVIHGKKDHYRVVIEELMRIAEAYRINSPDFQRLIDNTNEPFLREAFQTAQDGMFSREDFARIMRSRVHAMFTRYTEDAFKFKVVGRFPPAFGLMGTTLGMISLLQKLGDPNAQKLIGPAMALALIATLYGLALANLMFNPIAENLMDSAKEMKTKNTIIIEGVLLILEKTNPVILAEEMNSFLLPGERIDWRKVTNAGTSSAAPASLPPSRGKRAA